MIKLPQWKLGKKTTIFLGSVIVLGSYGAYDKYHLSIIKQNLISQAQVRAEESIGTLEKVPKVLIYIAPSQWARNWFDKFVKPVLDAGALDYDLIQTKELTELRWKIREKLWDAKEGWTSSRKIPTWFQWMRGQQGDVLPPSNPNYHVDESYIALGPEVWDEMMLGMNEGCLGKRATLPVESMALPTPITPSTESSNTSISNEEIKKEESSNGETPTTQETKQEEELPKETPQPLNPSDLSIDNINASFPIPSIGFIPAYDQVGWKAFPKRIFGFFHERHTFAVVGQEALKIVLGSKRSPTVNEIIYEKDDVLLNLDEHLVSKTFIYT